MPVHSIDSNVTLTGNQTPTSLPSLSPTQIQNMTPEQLREALRLQLSSQNLFSTPNDEWDPTPLTAKDEAQALALEITTLAGDLQKLHDDFLDEEGGSSLSKSEEEIIEIITEKEKALESARTSLRKLRDLLIEHPGSTSIQGNLDESEAAIEKAKRILDLMTPFKEEIEKTLRLNNPTSADDFSTHVTETTTDAEGNEVFELVNGNLLLNLTGENDVLTAKQSMDGIYFKIKSGGESTGWIKVPSDVKKIFINARAGDDTIKLKALDIEIPITVFGGADHDKVEFHKNGTTFVYLGGGQKTNSGDGGGGKSEYDKAEDQIDEIF